MLSRVEIVMPAVAVKVRFQMAEETSRAGGGVEQNCTTVLRMGG